MQNRLNTLRCKLFQMFCYSMLCIAEILSLEHKCQVREGQPKRLRLTQSSKTDEKNNMHQCENEEEKVKNENTYKVKAILSYEIRFDNLKSLLFPTSYLCLRTMLNICTCIHVLYICLDFIYSHIFIV